MGAAPGQPNPLRETGVSRLTRTAAHERKGLLRPVLTRADIPSASQVGAWGAVVVKGSVTRGWHDVSLAPIPTTEALQRRTHERPDGVKATGAVWLSVS